jgi:hypothetical protein
LRNSAAGWLAALAAGAAAGGLLGGLLGALEKAGVPRNKADVSDDGVRLGSMLLSVRVSDDLYQPSLAMTLAAGFPRESNADS